MESTIHKVALLTDGIFPFVTGGMQKHSYYLLRHLLENGIEVILYHCVDSDQRIHPTIREEHRHLLTEVTFQFSRSPSLPGSYLRDSKAYSGRIAEDILLRKDIDFIYAQGFTAWQSLELKAKGAPLPEVGVNFHGLEMYQYAKGLKSRAIQRMFRPAVKANCQMADIVYSLGGKLTDILNEIIAPEKVRVIPIGIERSWLREPEIIQVAQRIQAVFIGRYERRKGIEELNVVMRRMVDAPIDFHLIGPIEADKQVDQKGVTYHGMITDEERIRTIFDDCDLMLVPSLAEGMPTVILEGMARGLAIVASDVGAVCEEVTNENGRLITAGDVGELEATIRELMSLPLHVLLEMKRASRQKVERDFLWERIIQLTIKQIGDDAQGGKNEDYL